MTTQDPFLDMLTAESILEDAKAQRNKRRRDLEIPGVVAYEVSLPPAPWSPERDDEMELPKPHARPDFADDIDRIVADMVAAGLVVFDQETDSYRRPNVRRWRFA